jgi:hypothetical protein
MDKSIINLLLKLLGFSIGLFGIHYYIILQFFDGTLVIPLWVIYIFNAAMVFIVFAILKHNSKDKSKDMLKLFLILTIVKMALTIVLLLPLFLKKSDHTQLEVFNFFIPYFLFLIFEIFSLNKFLQKS